jgi:hypothetical protein
LRGVYFEEGSDGDRGGDGDEKWERLLLLLLQMLLLLLLMMMIEFLVHHVVDRLQ